MRTAKQLDEVIALLASLFPKTFAVFEQRRRPLKLKIHVDLVAALGEVEHLNAALGYNCRNIGYQRALRLGARQIDLAGNDAGEVDAAQALNAQKARRRGEVEAGGEARALKCNEVAPEVPPIVTPKPAALRASARRRLRTWGVGCFSRWPQIRPRIRFSAIFLR